MWPERSNFIKHKAVTPRRYTIADGVIYDTAELLVDVRELVAKSWEGHEDEQAIVAPSAAHAAEGSPPPKTMLGKKAVRQEVG